MKERIAFLSLAAILGFFVSGCFDSGSGDSGVADDAQAISLKITGMN